MNSVVITLKTWKYEVENHCNVSFPCQKEPSRMSCCSGSCPSSSEHERSAKPSSAEKLFPVFQSIE